MLSSHHVRVQVFGHSCPLTLSHPAGLQFTMLADTFSVTRVFVPLQVHWFIARVPLLSPELPQFKVFDNRCRSLYLMTNKGFAQRSLPRCCIRGLSCAPGYPSLYCLWIKIKVDLLQLQGYGDKGIAEIPGGATLELDVELLSIKQSPFGSRVKVVEG